MFKVSFKLNGQTVNPNNIANELEKAVLKRVQDYVIKTVGSVRCQTHGSGADITVTGKKADDLKFEIKGCCEDFIAQVKEKLKK